MAREFAPSIDTSQSNFSNRSQGIPTNRAFETLFEGFGQAAAGAATVFDESVQRDIRGSAEQEFDRLNEDFGFVPESVVANPGEMPTEIRTAQDNIARLARAREQGKLTDTAYYSRMVSTVRRLKANYPGYSEQVDAIIQDVTGTRPANALRSAMLQELADSEAEARAGADRDARWADQNAALIELFAPGYYTGELTIDDARQRVRREQSKLERINYESALEGRTKVEQQRMLDTHVTSLARSAIRSGANQLGIDFDSAGSLRGLFDNPEFNPQEFAIELDSLKLQAAQQIEQSMFDPETGQVKPAYSLLSASERRELVNQGLGVFDDIKEAVGIGDYDAIDFMANQIKLLEDKASLDFIRANPNLRNFNAAMEAMGPQIAEVFLNTTDQGMRIQKDIANAMVIDLYTQENVTPATQLQTMNDSPSLTPQEKNQVATEYVSRARNTLSNSAPGPETADFVKRMFANGGMDIYDNINSDQRLDFWNMMASPKIARNIAATGDDEAIQAYADWMTESFPKLAEFRTLASTNSTTERISPVTDIEFENGRFTVQFNEEEARRLSGGSDSPMGNARQFSMYEDGVMSWTARIEQINKAIATLTPILEAQGLQGEAATREAVRMLNEEASGGMVAPDSLLGKMIQRLDQPDEISGVQANETEMGEIQLANAKQALAREGVAASNNPEVRNLLDMIAVAEGNTDYDTVYGYRQDRYGWKPSTMTIREVQEAQRRLAADTGSSAFGKYQIMQYTLRDAINSLGLSPDDVFSPELQDRIATDFLLKRRGYEDWQMGRINDQQFLNNLAREWASIPTTGGISAYEGDRMGNKASSGGQAIAAMINQ